MWSASLTNLCNDSIPPCLYVCLYMYTTRSPAFNKLVLGTPFTSSPFSYTTVLHLVWLDHAVAGCCVSI